MVEPIKIMMIYEKTRGLTEPTLAHGAAAAVHAINAAGGLRSRPLELIDCDTLDDPETAAACGHRAVEEGVVALVGSLSVHSGDFMTTMAQSKIPSIGLIPATAADFTSPAAFPIVGGPPVSLAYLAGALVDQGARKISLVRPDVAAGSALAAFANLGLRRFGLEVSNDVAVPSGVADMAPYLEACPRRRRGRPPRRTRRRRRSARHRRGPSIGCPAPIAERGADETGLVDELGASADRILGSTYFFTLSTKNEATSKFITEMRASGRDDADLSGRHAQDTYAAVLTFAAVAEQLPEVTATALFEKLPSVRG